MRTYTYSEARQRLADLLDQARRDGRVLIRRRDGTTFALQPVTMERSPLDVPAVSARLKRGELVDLVRGERIASGRRLLAPRRPSRRKR